MKTVFLVPRRRDRGHRDALWEWCRARWEATMPDVEIVEGHHEDGAFNRSAAINTAARLAGDWDVAVIIDSDVFLRESQVRAAIARATKSGKVTWAHTRWRGFSEERTLSVINPRNPHDFGAEVDRNDIDLYVEKTTPISWSCCVVVPRNVWDQIGGFDERFVGWGFEDHAFRAVVCGLYGWDRLSGDVYHLWHPRSEERIVKGQPHTTSTPDYIRNALLGRRYQIAIIRDHGIGDQLGQEKMGKSERDRHVANLTKDDRRFLALGKRTGMPDWSEWWPTLEELNAEAQEYRDRQEKGVTVVVTSGGPAENWPARAPYLRQSLASLTENVTGTIVQRVIYSDWPDSVRPELEAIATEHGFYVVGEGNHGHTAMRQRLWRYLAKHAQAPFVFATEDDFLYRQPVDLDAMVRTLRDQPHLAQVALLRDAFYPDERETGGILGWPEPAFTRAGQNGSSRLEHTLFWTNNPAIFRASITKNPWPESQKVRTGRGKGSEEVFGDALLRSNPNTRFAFWGSGENQVVHIGQVRAGSGY